MNTKLTLRLNEELINKAKNYAKKEGKSLSQIVSDFFVAISSKKQNSQNIKLKPNTSKLYASLKGSLTSKEDYKKHIENKYLWGSTGFSVGKGLIFHKKIILLFCNFQNFGTLLH